MSIGNQIQYVKGSGRFFVCVCVFLVVTYCMWHIEIVSNAWCVLFTFLEIPISKSHNSTSEGENVATSNPHISVLLVRIRFQFNMKCYCLILIQKYL